MAFQPAEPGSNEPCDKCGAPASWADNWAANLTYSEGQRYQVNVFLASPRMWPFGYLLTSPYSPFHIERDMPDRKWRDAFEDLLALDSAGQMIDARVREGETETAKHFFLQRLHRKMSLINKVLKSQDKQVAKWKELRAKFKKVNDTEGFKSLDDFLIPNVQKSIEELVATGRKFVTKAKDGENNIWPASKYKSRSQWMTSLLTSGAVVGWKRSLFNSDKGDYSSFEKTEINEDGYNDAIYLTEADMQQYFEEGKPMLYRPPAWSTDIGQYPTLVPTSESLDENSINDNESAVNAPQSSDPISLGSQFPNSFLSQVIRTERTVLGSGRLSVRVLISNQRVNGRVEEKELTDNASAVLEEIDKAHESMTEVTDGFMAFLDNQQVALQEAAIAAVHDEDDLD